MVMVYAQHLGTLRSQVPALSSTIKIMIQQACLEQMTIELNEKQAAKGITHASYRLSVYRDPRHDGVLRVGIASAIGIEIEIEIREAMSLFWGWNIGVLGTVLAVGLGLVIGIEVLGRWFRSNRFVVGGKTILLTGASEGMGKAVAIELAKKGASVIIVARNVGKLEGALGEIEAAALSPANQFFHYISADVSIPTEAARILQEATAFNSGTPPDIVWCIAGTSTPGFFLDTTPAKLRTQMDINYWSCADMAHCVLKAWLSTPNTERKDRHLIFTSSVLAFYSIVGYTPYSPPKQPSKQARDWSWKIREKPEITHQLESTDPIQTPEEVAKNAIRGLERGEYLVTVGWLGSLMRACAWGGSRRGDWLLDTIVTWVTSLVWWFVGRDLDGQVKKWGEVKEFGRGEKSN
ncbi:hypothetical protein EYC84_003695 [Monilinia fructicola]|uniref:3-ketodihydrosphingosine reductase tsc10 n=1 Tax=Monilinia fructicola TaxID=38448 RepID=A0A5M9JX10_MONFR|nr:hypothetical protein EYC84_003695 [Monilinia fructicola]